MSKKIKWGIIGAGSIAAKFASDFENVNNAEILGIASLSQERADDFAHKWNIPHAFGSYEALFSLDIDVVYIASRHPFHKEHTLLCLNNNVAALCEKPFGMNAHEVESMLTLAASKKIFLMEALWTRFLPSTLKAQELLKSGILGKIITFQADFGFKGEYDPTNRLYDPEKGGGAMLDIGIYPAFMSMFLFGMPSKILATAILSPTGTDETTSFIFKYENEMTSVLNATFAANTACEATIYGENGKIIIHSRFHEAKKVSLVLNDGTEQSFDFPRDTHGYDFETEHVNQCLRDGLAESNMMSHTDSRNLIKLLDQVQQLSRV